MIRKKRSEAANEKIIAADVVIWSFPLYYYYSLPGLLKVFVDRQVPTMRPIMQERIDGKGNGKHASRYDLSHQRHILISTCGFCYYKGNYDAVKAQFDLILGVDNYTTLFCGQGEMLQNYAQEIPLEDVSEGAESIFALD